MNRNLRGAVGCRLESLESLEGLLPLWAVSLRERVRLVRPDCNRKRAVGRSIAGRSAKRARRQDAPLVVAATI